MGNAQGSDGQHTTRDTRIALFLMRELVQPYAPMTLALQALSVRGHPSPWRASVGVCRRGGLLLVWLDPFLTVEEQDRLPGWHLGVSL